MNNQPIICSNYDNWYPRISWIRLKLGRYWIKITNYDPLIIYQRIDVSNAYTKKCGHSV